MRRTVARRPNGVALCTRREGVPVGIHVHAQDKRWRITSNVPVGPELLLTSVLDVTLPGALGRYLLPEDAVFHVLGQPTTRTSDLLAVWDEESETTPRVQDTVLHLNHLTVRAVDPSEEEEVIADDVEDDLVSNESDDEGHGEEEESPLEEDPKDVDHEWNASDDDEGEPGPK